MKPQIIAATLLTAFAALSLSACRPQPLVSDLQVSPAALSPDGDGQADVARISYRVGRPATVSIVLEDAEGKRHLFRDQKPRQAGDYQALFGGAIDGQVLADGKYRLLLDATPAGDGKAVSLEAALTIAGADTEAPRLEGLSLAPDLFTPNQDGIGDRVKLSYTLSEQAAVRLWLEDDQGRYVQDILEDLDSAETAGEVGPHTYDFDGGVDADAPPPPDGDYLVVAEVRDVSGNRALQRLPLAIRQGGQPRAALTGDVSWSSSVVSVGATLWFTVTVRNVGATPLRSFGPPPGFVYDSERSFNQRAPQGSWLLARRGRPVPGPAEGGDSVASSAKDDAPPYAAASRWVPSGDGRPLLLDLAPVDPLALAARRDPFAGDQRPSSNAAEQGKDAVEASGPGEVRSAGATGEASTVETTGAIDASDASGALGGNEATDASGATGSQICGTVTHDGRPVPGAEVFAFDAVGGQGRRAVADEAGSFCLAPPPAQTASFAPSPGALRIGLACDALESDVDYPFRWQLGAMESLDVCDVDGRLYLCLAPGTETVASGGLRFTERPNRRGTKVYLSLQHEDVRMIQGPFGVRGLTVEGE